MYALAEQAVSFTARAVSWQTNKSSNKQGGVTVYSCLNSKASETELLQAKLLNLSTEIIFLAW